MQARAALHRPYLLRPLPAAGEEDRFAQSRCAAVTLALRGLKTQIELTDLLPLEHKGYGFLAHCAFESGVTLCIAALMELKRVRAFT